MLFLCLCVCLCVCVFWAGDGRLAFCARCFSSFSITGLSVGASVRGPERQKRPNVRGRDPLVIAAETNEQKCARVSVSVGSERLRLVASFQFKAIQAARRKRWADADRRGDKQERK